ncbi:MAG: restriction endonuclease [Reyranella sp.]|nr:restriction endonuclease [Reyranella sp.]
MQTVPRNLLDVCDLDVDAKYEGSRAGNAGDDPLHELLGVSIGGGFRIRGTLDAPRLIVLTSSLSDADWPDELDLETGIFTYFGDNKEPGRELHNTKRWGNRLLRFCFDAAHTGARKRVPPILIFTSAGHWRDMIFRGLAVPGGRGLMQQDDLVAIWRTKLGQRFQNYRAKFTVVDAGNISRAWIDDIQAGRDNFPKAPRAWRQWIEDGEYLPLVSPPTSEIRTRAQQTPQSLADRAILQEVHGFFAGNPTDFEACAAEIVRIALGGGATMDLTRPTRDGGRDAVGVLHIGTPPSAVAVDFAIEAKCYGLGNSVGVREMSRLISRLRHRQFGVMVTTSWVNAQAYNEVVEDGHPIMIIAGADVVRILRQSGITTRNNVRDWLISAFGRERVAALRAARQVP